MRELLTWQGTTPKGKPVSILYRKDAVDLQTIQQTILRDEYRLAGLDLSGIAIDAGGYIGTVAVILAIDNPSLSVLCLEPIPENRELLQQNIALNGVSDRVKIDSRALVGDNRKTLQIDYRPESPSGFIGRKGGDTSYCVATKTIKAKTVNLSKLRAEMKETPSILKIDIEGGEYSALTDISVREIPIIIGEWHPVKGGAKAALNILLGSSHDLTFNGQDEWFGIFHAYRAERANIMQKAQKPKPVFIPPKAARAWERCQIDSLEVAARWLEMGDAARNGDRPISREEALQCVRMVQQEIIEKERSG